MDIDAVARSNRIRALLVTWMCLLTGCQFMPSALSFLTPGGKPVSTHEFVVRENDDLIGQIVTTRVENGDTLPDIARHYGLGYNDIIAANPGIKVWLPQPESRITLPLFFILPDTSRQDLVLNLASMRLFFYSPSPQKPKRVTTFPIGIGRQGWSTPTGRLRITEKKTNPNWYVPASIRREHAQMGDPLPAVVRPGPLNPLGSHAMRLSLPKYLIHGTNKPFGIGMRISHGCVRLYPENIKILYPNVDIGTKVKIINEPYLLGWRGGMLYVEIHEPLEQGKGIRQRLRKQFILRLKQLSEGVTIDWNKVEQALDRMSGIPTPILHGSNNYEQLIDDARFVDHPKQLFGKPTVPPITSEDWSVTIGNFNNISDAQRFTEVLNHQGPQIPARSKKLNDSYQIIAGPFQNHRQAYAAMKLIRREFRLQATVLEPSTITVQ